MERRIGEICRKTARELLEQNRTQVKITAGNLVKYLGKEKIQFDAANEDDQVGIVRGLAWTSVGGDTLEIEVNTMPGEGKIQLTGQLGDVMKESAQPASAISDRLEVSTACPKTILKSMMCICISRREPFRRMVLPLVSRWQWRCFLRQRTGRSARILP